MKIYKTLSILFAVLAVLLSNILCAVTAWNYCNFQWSIQHQGFSGPANLALLTAVPYGIGIAVCAVLAVVFHKNHLLSRKRPVTPLGEEEVRVVKIGRDALFELIYESFVDNQAQYFDVDPLAVADTFFMDWETGQFIFCVHKDEDETDKMIPLPEEISLPQLLQILPDTTHSMYTDRRYRVYSKEELIELSKTPPTI